eukprot:TRINITY_DN8773_c0_g1_i1.p1 TRINITY_DN8773_c0_g1~~TRINITY_DN8773_c0_g1_i1.p1  ORF type:complete len:394 (-),score=134.85 TRINITY_DN8773_c0_g1_i1:335-1516(-)
MVIAAFCRALATRQGIGKNIKNLRKISTMPNFSEPKFRGPKRTKTAIPLSRVELHIHLDGCVRMSTIWELCKAKGLSLPGRGTIEDLTASVEMNEPGNLTSFLSGFQYTAPALSGDLVAIERIAREFCEDAAHNGLLYVESRFCPHLLLPEAGSGDTIVADDIVEAVLRGFKAGEEEYGLTARVLLCCIRGLDQFSEDVLRLCVKYRDQGVVGMDIAGDEEGLDPNDPDMFNPTTIKVFTEAKELGINRTVHAGEVGPAKCVEQALSKLFAQRIGHGYRVLEDEELYAKCLKDQVHFETCPTSSILTGAQPLSFFYHAVCRFCDDKANFSINTDDSMVTGTWTEQEYELVRSWGLKESHLVRANINAMKASFLPEDEKAELLNKLYSAYGIEL